MPVKVFDAGYARKTYRYLRLGLVGSALMLAVAVAFEHWKAPSCFQTSISSYYYTPARAVFVGALVAIGIALIVIKGTGWEDVALNLAGMLAPVVAFVPTINVGGCWSIQPQPDPLASTNPPVLADWVIRNIENNMWSLLITGAFGVLAAYVLYSINKKSPTAAFDLKSENGDKKDDAAVRKGLLVVTAVIIVATVLWWRWPAFKTQSHNAAAILMFVFLAWAAMINGHRRKQAAQRNYSLLYYAIAGLMALTALVVFVAKLLIKDWNHSVLVLEMLEIVWFTIYWGVQTREYWHEEVAPPSV